jgi:pimeloyl-ACP methyl ester carboxylesterase
MSPLSKCNLIRIPKLVMKKCIMICSLVALFSGGQLFAQQPIGTTTWLLTDATRDGREITCNVLYPGVSSAAEAAPDNGPFPLIVFGHGFLLGPEDYENLASGLVNAGYIIALVATEQTFAPSHQDFGLDLAFVAHELIQNGTSGVLTGSLLPTVAIMGHSMGGGAAWLAASANPLIETVVAFAPAETTPSAVAVGGDIQVPVLVLSGSADDVTPPESQHLPIYNATNTAPCRAFASIVDGGHCGFADPGTLCDLGEIGFSGLTHSEQLEITLSLVVPWLDRFLKNDPLAWWNFEDSSSTSDDLILDVDCTVNAVQHSLLNLKAYPNPAVNSMTLQWKAMGQTAQARVMDLSGRVQEKWTLTGISESRALRLEPGVYLLNIEQPGRLTESIKIIFQ